MGEIPQPPAEPPIARPRVWTVALACFALFVGLGAVSLLVALLTLQPRHLTATTPEGTPELIATLPSLLALAGATTAWIATVAVLAALGSPERASVRLGLVPPARGRDVGLWIAAILGALALSQAVDFALRLSGAGRGESLDHMLALLRQARGGWLALAIFVVGAGAGVAEELFFRGYVQRRLVQRYGGSAGVIAAAALFALAHFDPQHSTFAFLFGLYLGALVLWTGSTWTAIAVHAVNNATAVLLAATGVDDAADAIAPAMLLALFVAFAGAAVAALAFVRRRLRPTGNAAVQVTLPTDRADSTR